MKTPSGQTKSVFLLFSGSLYFINFEIFSLISSLDRSYFKSKLGETIFVKIEFFVFNSIWSKYLSFFFIIESP